MKYKIRERSLPTNNSRTVYEFIGTECEKISFDELVNQGVQYHSSFTHADLESAFELVFDLIKRNITRGNSVKTPVGIFEPVITGTAKDTSDSFMPYKDSNDHSVKVNLRVNQTFLKELQKEIKITREKNFRPKLTPVIESVRKVKQDGKSTADSFYENGDVVFISGKNLKINTEDPEQFLKLVNTDPTKGNFYIIKSFIKITGNTIIFTIPEKLFSGSYYIQLQNIPARKTYHKCTYSQPITVA